MEIIIGIIKMILIHKKSSLSPASPPCSPAEQSGSFSLRIPGDYDDDKKRR